MVFVNCTYDMVVDTQLHKFYGRQTYRRSKKRLHPLASNVGIKTRYVYTEAFHFPFLSFFAIDTLHVVGQT